MITSITGHLRPYASNDRIGALGRPQTVLRTAKNEDNPYAMFDRRMLKDKALGSTLRGVLINLLDHPDSWEFLHIVKEIQEDAGVSETTARKYLNQLIELGYVHKVSYQGSRRTDRHNTVNRYKISELPMKPGDGWAAQDCTFCEGGQVALFRDMGFPMGFQVKNYGALESEVKVTDMVPKRRNLTPNTGSKNYVTKRVRRVVPHSSEQQELPFIPLTREMTQMDDCRVECGSEGELPQLPRSTPVAVVKETRKSASPKYRKATAPAVRKQSPADFNALRRSAESSVPLDEFMAAYATALPAALDALAAAPRSDRPGWADAMLVNPLITMTQQVMGYSHWDHQSLRRWSRRLKRGTVKPWEIVNLWRAKLGGGNFSSAFLDETIQLLDSRDFRSLVVGHPYPIGWAERMDIIRNQVCDRMLQPLIHAIDGMVRYNAAAPCDSATSEGRDVRERALCWMCTPGQNATFFSSVGAEEWFDGALASHPAFWAAAAGDYLDLPLPAPVRAKLVEHVDRTPTATIDQWVAGITEACVLIPGGLSYGTVDGLVSGRASAPDDLYRSVLAALFGRIPDGVDLPDMHNLFNVGVSHDSFA